MVAKEGYKIGLYKIADSRSNYMGPLFPPLFVTIACGAVSGFHALGG